MFLDPVAFQENLKRFEKARNRHPRRHPKVVQHLVTKWSKSEPKCEQKKVECQWKSIAPTGCFLGLFCRHGGLKSVTSKISVRLPKNCSRCLKTLPKWFKNGSRLIKLFRIPPKIKVLYGLIRLGFVKAFLISPYKAFQALMKLIISISPIKLLSF